MYSFRVMKDGFELTDRSTGLIVKTGTFRECCKYILGSKNEQFGKTGKGGKGGKMTKEQVIKSMTFFRHDKYMYVFWRNVYNCLYSNVSGSNKCSGACKNCKCKNKKQGVTNGKLS